MIAAEYIEVQGFNKADSILKQMIEDYSNSQTLGIIKLWGEDQKGIKINATFSKKNPNAKVIFVDNINSIFNYLLFYKIYNISNYYLLV